MFIADNNSHYNRGVKMLFELFYREREGDVGQPGGDEDIEKFRRDRRREGEGGRRDENTPSDPLEE